MDKRLRQLADTLLAAKDSAAVQPRLIAPQLLPHVFILEIERITTPPRLRIRMTGTELARVFGRPLEGHYLDEFLHGPHGAEVIAGFRDCADTREPLWMRQVVRFTDRLPRFVEGIAIYLAPERLYGGLIVGEGLRDSRDAPFERAALV